MCPCRLAALNGILKCFAGLGLACVALDLAVTSAASAEMMAVASLFTYDVWKVRCAPVPFSLRRLRPHIAPSAAYVSRRVQQNSASRSARGRSGALPCAENCALGSMGMLCVRSLGGASEPLRHMCATLAGLPEAQGQWQGDADGVAPHCLRLRHLRRPAVRRVQCGACAASASSWAS